MSIQYYRRIILFFIASFCLPVMMEAQVFTKAVPPPQIGLEAATILSEVEFYDVNMDELKRKLNSSNKFEIDIPLGLRTKTITFEKTNILAPGYQLFTSSGKSFDTARKYAFYQGNIKGEAQSKASLIYYDNAFSMSIFDDDGNFEIHKEGDFYAGYFDHDRVQPIDLAWDCQVIDESHSKKDNSMSDSRSIPEPQCVTVFLELDHNMYTKKGSDIANAESWALTIMAQVAILFIEHNVPINVSGIQVWDTPDPYVSATNTSTALSLFRNAVKDNPNFNGRLAHLLSGRSLGGGIAYLNSLCSTSTNVAVSANLTGAETEYPIYSWNVMVVTHELGHNLGSPHTHSCSWNGNNTAIDGCGNIQGSCPDPGNPPNSVGGTIMSYCHLTSSGINFKNGFGPQPGALIEERYVNASCVTGENCSFVSPFNDVCDRAKELPVLNYCIPGHFNNFATTPSGDGGNMSCGDTGVENDIWYKFDRIDVDTIHIEVQASAYISDLVVELYSGDCDNLTSIDCGFSIAGSQISFALDDPMLINETLFIRIVEKDSDEEGEFSICLYSEELPCQVQFDTLLNIYQELDGPNWTANSGWADGILNGTCDYCNWQGITCDYLGNIVEIDLSSNNLSGMLPEDLTALTNLQYLRLNNNMLFDTIPNYWDSLDQLYLLDLRFNALSGSIPLSYTTMTKINTIHLDNNSLDSLIPPGLGYNGSLRTFTASNNQLEGCFSAGLSSFCYKDSLNLDNNADLPYGGDVTLLCEEGWGTDWDLDGFCNEIEDCNDFDVDINPDAEEVLCDAKDNNCDGNIDEGSNFGPNVWIGPDTLGVFDDSLNWSLGHVPLICENVEIGMNGDTIDLSLLGNDSGGGTGGSNNYFQLNIRSLSIGENTTIHMSEFGNLSILGNGVIVNHGTFNTEGYFNIRDQYDTPNTALVNHGRINIIGYGGFSINEVGDYALHNGTSGEINMEGYCSIDLAEGETAYSAIINEGILRIFGTLWIYGDFENQAVKNENGGTIEIKNAGFLNLY